ncbi:glycerophosphodiester phosphodiesterase family protein [Terricaulis sp.]|uniref:glycerophosphodiester phosphodiesterase family protein n=1 Tax=Terricaulis sp. TaxID=2768686 RepID=UPI003782F6B6
MRRRDLLIAATVLGGCANMGEQESERPVVIGHRGASGERPEHTLASYRLAIQQGADYIEPDLVMTKDHVLVCRHENEIGGTTDVGAHREFADRRKQKTVDGVTATGWWVEDFTLAELKTLRAKERLPQLRPGNAAYDGQETVPTFAEALALSREAGVGIYPELKHPTFLRGEGLDPVPAFIDAVRAGGGQAAADAMFVQCFEVGALRTLAQMSSIRWRCIQLMSADGGPFDLAPGVSYRDMITGRGLDAVREYAEGIGVEKAMIIPRDSEGRSQTPTGLVRDAHIARLKVHAWTFRAENYFLPVELRRGDVSAPDYMRQHGDLDAELRAFYAAGVDGVFSDFPGMAVAART